MPDDKKPKKEKQPVPAGTVGGYYPKTVFYKPEENTVESNGNADAKILAKAFEEFSKDGITNQEREKIEKFDEILKGADIVINKAGTMATIAQEDGHTFNIDKSRGKNR
jgi:hypothetical protein